MQQILNIWQLTESHKQLSEALQSKEHNTTKFNITFLQAIISNTYVCVRTNLYITVKLAYNKVLRMNNLDLLK